MGLGFGLHVEVDTGGQEPIDVELGAFNITHNVSPMWVKAGVYDALYNSDRKDAGEILETLREGKVDFIADLNEYEKLNPPNGWGTVKDAFGFLESVIALCEKHPKAKIWISA